MIWHGVVACRYRSWHNEDPHMVWIGVSQECGPGVEWESFLGSNGSVWMFI